MDVKEIGRDGVDWLHLAQDRDQWRDFVNSLMNLRVSQKAENFSTNWITTSWSSRTPFHWVSQSVKQPRTRLFRKFYQKPVTTVTSAIFSPRSVFQTETEVLWPTPVSSETWEISS
jgi:hypothetical protein